MASDLKDVQPSTGSPSPLGGQSSFRFYTRRRRIYTWLLLFVVIVGLPIVTVPPLRDRLSARVQILKIALAGGIEPITLKVGENLEPFPKEYQKPLPQLPHPPQLPPLERIFTASSSHAPQAPSARPQSSPSVAHKVMKITIPQPSPTSPSAAEQPTEQAAAPTSAEPQYRQGKIEQEAYDLLLKSNATVAGMVQGSNPSLRFKSWDAAKRQEDTYWVRLKFQSSPGEADVEYIWQVNLLSMQVTPLSYNARSIS